MNFEEKGFYKGIRLFLFISFLSITVILLTTVSKETKKGLQLISPLFIGITLLSSSFSQFFNIWRLRYIIKAMGKNLSWSGSFYYTIGGAFLGGITPFQVGGIPLQLYLCKRENITIPEASVAIFTRGLLSALVLPLLIPLIYYYRVYFTKGIIQGIIKYVSIFYGLLVLLLIFALLKTEWFIKKLKGNFFKGILEFKEVLGKEFFKRKKDFSKAYILTAISLFFNFLIAFFLIRGLGVGVDFIKATVIQIILTYALAFMPTPGASGLAEGSAYGLFKELMPQSILGVYVILWRFFTGYLWMIIGGFSLTRLFSKLRKKQKLSYDEPQPLKQHKGQNQLR
ncbi:MAG: lysylphosphatidylglycerol synthase transmembrane domain-containing protein [candidate division WOR-3 bacterium]